MLLFTADMLILRLRVNYRPGAQFYGEQKWEARKFRAPGQAQARKVRAARACAPKNDRPALILAHFIYWEKISNLNEIFY